MKFAIMQQNIAPVFVVRFENNLYPSYTGNVGQVIPLDDNANSFTLKECNQIVNNLAFN